jgi:S-formylglutathione hydrolase FrmB
MFHVSNRRFSTIGCIGRWATATALTVTSLVLVAAPSAQAASGSPALPGLSAPSPECVVRTAPISQAPATLAAQRLVPGSGGRVLDLTLNSPAMGTTEHVDVLLPKNFDPSGTTRYPVLYLLHGAGGAYSDWVDHGVEQLIDSDTSTQHLPAFITVMPSGGAWGYYVDWYGSDVDGTTPSTVPAWSTFDINELIPYIDAHFPTRTDRGGRAIAGLSMGGFGTMSLAARFPDLFGVAGSFSGAVDPDYEYPIGNEILNAASSTFTDAAPEACVWGDPLTNDVFWENDDPTYLAPALAHTSLFVASGDGTPGPFDNTSTPSDAVNAYGAAAVESLIWDMNQSFSAALQADHIAFTSFFYGPGTHSWPYWLRDLTHFLPQMASTFDGLAASTMPFSYRTTATSFSVWGWHFAAAREASEFTYLDDVNTRGLIVAGSGTLQVTTAPLYVPGASYSVLVGNTTPSTKVSVLRANGLGELQFPVDLGPPHAVQQTDFSAGATDSWIHALVVITAQGS